jgi:hypothetical protein
MKTLNNLYSKKIVVLLLAMLVISSASGNSLKGRLQDGSTTGALSFASIAIFDSTVTHLSGGTTTCPDGYFNLQIPAGEVYTVRFSSIGYKTVFLPIDMRQEQNLDLGVVMLWPAEYMLEQVVVEAQQIRGQAAGGSVTYLVNKNMKAASHTGLDVLRMIPGVHLDVRQNISLEGNADVIILVDGRERDRSYLNQLQVSQIEKIDVISTPSSQYNASGMISITTRKDSNRGMQGQVYAEIPVSEKEMFIFPSYSISYGQGKFNWFTSYNGEMLRFSIVEKYHRNLYDRNEQIESRQEVIQNSWSHKFHLGSDYFASRRSQLNFYGWYNSSSHEHDGRVQVQHSDKGAMEWKRDDDDLNQSGYVSMFFRHLISPEKGHEINAYFDLYGHSGRNSTMLLSGEDALAGATHARHLNQSARIHHILPLMKGMKTLSGLEYRNRRLWDKSQLNFNQQSELLALYSVLQFQYNRFDVNAGVRGESIRFSRDRMISKLLPEFAAAFRISSAQMIRFSHRGFIQWPGIYQMNPARQYEDAFSIFAGNPMLKPVSRNNTSLEFNQRIGHHLLSARLFHHFTRDVINMLMLPGEDGAFYLTRENLGDIRHTGLQLSGAAGLGKWGGIQPFVSVFDARTRPGERGRAKGVVERRQWALNAGASAFAALGKGYVAAIQLKYASPLNNLQDNYFEGMQYFLSLEKSFAGNFKAGIVSAMPLTRKYTYRGSETQTSEFHDYSTGQIQMSAIPVWFKFSWQFQSGQKRAAISRSTEAPEEKRSKGFGSGN